jgi:single-stranded DNA-binding protein
MPIKTSQSMAGFVASAPELSRPQGGEPRLWMRVGQEHFTRNQDGSFTRGESSFHDLVMFRKSAERAAAAFKKGDRFVADGHIHAYEQPGPDGVAFQREEFVARRIGHDLAVTNYQVDRTRTMSAAEAAAKGRITVNHGPARDAAQPAPATAAGPPQFTQPPAPAVHAPAGAHGPAGPTAPVGVSPQAGHTSFQAAGPSMAHGA